jgi:thymidine kinase
MSSGKTYALYGEMKTLEAVGVNYIAFQPSVDVRSRGTITPKTFSGDLEPNCIIIPSLIDVSDDHLQGANAVAIDEFTLFGFDKNGEPIANYYEDSMRHLAELGVKAVYGAGLSVAANGEILPLLKSAIENGVDIEWFTARCMFPANGSSSPKCANDARNTQIYSISQEKPYDPSTLPMLLPEGERPDLGYRPVCVGHKAVNAAGLLDFNADYPS